MTHLVESRATPVECGKSLVQGDDIGRKLGQDTLLDSLIDTSSVGSLLDAVLANDVDLVVQVEQVVSGVKNDTRGPDTRLFILLSARCSRPFEKAARPGAVVCNVTYQNDGVDQLTPQHLLQLVSKAGVVSALLHNDIPILVDVEGGIDLRDIVDLGSVAGELGGDGTKGCLGANLGSLGVGKVDPGEDGERRG